MKVRKISSHITKLEVWIGITFSAWLVEDEDGVTIIDTGMPFMGKAILREARKLGKIKAVLLTHGHGDHVGGLSYIAKEARIPVYAHKLELKYIEGEEPFPGRKKSRSSGGGWSRTAAANRRGPSTAADTRTYSVSYTRTFSWTCGLLSPGRFRINWRGFVHLQARQTAEACKGIYTQYE